METDKIQQQNNDHKQKHKDKLGYAAPEEQKHRTAATTRLTPSSSAYSSAEIRCCLRNSKHRLAVAVGLPIVPSSHLGLHQSQDKTM